MFGSSLWFRLIVLYQKIWIISSKMAYSPISRTISVRSKVIYPCWPIPQMFWNFKRSIITIKHVICWISTWFMILMMPLICLMIVQSGVDVIIGLATFNQVVFEYYWIRNISTIPSNIMLIMWTVYKVVHFRYHKTLWWNVTNHIPNPLNGKTKFWHNRLYFVYNLRYTS